MEKNPSDKIQILLFDLGGVLVDIQGMPVFLKESAKNLSAEEVWFWWLNSEAVKSFERGKNRPEEFAKTILSHWKLKKSVPELLDEFLFWPRALFDGAEILLKELRGNFTLGILSNSNNLHWPRFQREWKLQEYFDYCFMSHLIGHVKPEPEIYAYINERLKIPPSSIFFLDDNQVNVDAAIRAGWQSERVKGMDETRKALARRGLLK